MSFGKVLIVDDEADLRELLDHNFEMNDFETLQAADGLSACRLIGEHRPDLVVLDLMLPDLDGRDSSHLGSLAEDLLLLRRIENGEVDVPKELVDPDTLIREVLGLYRGLADERRISLSATLARDLPTPRANQAALRIVLSCLVENAVKYGRTNGTVHVSCSPFLRRVARLTSCFRRPPPENPFPPPSLENADKGSVGLLRECEFWCSTAGLLRFGCTVSWGSCIFVAVTYVFRRFRWGRWRGNGQKRTG